MILGLIASETQRMTASRETARASLVEAGIYTAEGELRTDTGGDEGPRPPGG